jgi:zinc transport system substrate-binding protein
MLWEAEPAHASVERLRALGVQSVVFNPCANRPTTGDFLSAMKGNAENLERAFQ